MNPDSQDLRTRYEAPPRNAWEEALPLIAGGRASENRITRQSLNGIKLGIFWSVKLTV